jgi:hypothetical protein
VKRSALPFTGFRGLLSDGTYRLGLFPNSAQMYYLQVSRDAARLVMKLSLETQPPLIISSAWRVCDVIIASLLHKMNQNHDIRNIVDDTEHCSRWDTLLRMSRTDKKLFRRKI